MTKTNTICCRTVRPTVFVTAIFGVLDKASGRFTFCNAGHPPALSMSKSGVTRLATRRANLPLGVLDDAEFSEYEVGLDKDEILFLYTDGLIEARSEKTLFGEQALVDLLGSTDSPYDVLNLPSDVFQDVAGAGEYRQVDDIAILALSRVGKDSVRRTAPADHILDEQLEVFTAVAEALTDSMLTTGAAVYALEDEKYLCGRAIYPPDLMPNFQNVAIDLGDEQSAAASAARSGAPLVIVDAQNAAGSKIWLARLTGAKSLLAVPIMNEERIIGVAVAVETVEKREFTDEEIDEACDLCQAAARPTEQLTTTGS